MPTLDVQLHCPLHDSFRVQQIAGMFDLDLCGPLSETLAVDIPAADEPWTLGAIVGASGSGKTAVARAAYGDRVYQPTPWPADRATIDCFGQTPIAELTRTFTSVGFSSPRCWVKPFAVLSNGEKFRCELARAISAPAEGDSPLVVFDEFTSVVGRSAAKNASAALARSIRRGTIRRRFVAVTCHEDIVPWLSPDWVLDMDSRSLARGRLRRPCIRLRIERAGRDLWPRFQRHHYLSGQLHRSAQCFVGRVGDCAAAFAAVLPFPHPRRSGYREHRLVCLPDFQGIGIGSALSDFVAGLYVATGKPYFSTSGHPAVLAHRTRSPLWAMRRPPGAVSAPSRDGERFSLTPTLSRHRFTAGFEFVGPPRAAAARALGVVQRLSTVAYERSNRAGGPASAFARRRRQSSVV